MQSKAPTKTRPRRFRRILLLVSAVLLVTVVVLGIVALRLASQPPEWWAEAKTLPPNAAARAEQVEAGLANLAQKPRREEQRVWAAALTEADLNAWLAHRLADWLENRAPASAAGWPEEIGAPRVSLTDRGTVLVGAMVEDRVVSAELRPLLAPQDGDARLTVELVDAQVGSLSLPEWAMQRFDGALPEAIDELLGQSGGIEVEHQLPDGRVVRLMEVKVQPDQLVLWLKTERRTAAPAAAE